MKSEFKIESAVYRVLYKSLCDKIEKEIIKGRPRKFKTSNRRELFDLIEEKPIGDRLIKDSLTPKISPRYFYRRVVDLSVDTLRGKFDPYLLYNALNEIGYSLDEKYIKPKTANVNIIQNSKSQNLLDQFVSMHAADIRDEQNKVDPAFYIPSVAVPTNNIVQKSDQNLEEKFLNAIRALRIYYKHLEQTYTFESDQFYALLKHIEPRLVNQKKIKEDGNLVKRLENKIQRQSWSIYELEHDKIIERKIQFYLHEPKFKWEEFIKIAFIDLFDNESEKLEPYICHLDFLHNSIRFNNHTTSSGLQTVTFYSFSYVDETTLNLCVGHKLSYQRETESFTSKIVAMKAAKQNEENKDNYIEHDLRNNTVPEYIRSILLCPSEGLPSPPPFLHLHDTINKIINFITIH